MLMSKRVKHGEWDLKKDLDLWSLHVEKENCASALSRFLIALEELRVRLAPFRYPNIEISEEGHLWFNIDTSMGTVEVLAFPFGFKEVKSPSIAVSLPRKAEDVSLSLLNKLRQIADNVDGAKVFADKSATGVSEILGAFRRNEHPLLTLTSNLSEILEMKRKGAFFSYLGISFSVVDKTVSDIERIIREILLKLEEK